MKKEIPVNIVEEDTTRYETKEEFETYKTIEEKEIRYKEYAIYTIIILLVIGLFSLFASDWFDIEKERKAILIQEEIKLKKVKAEKEVLLQKVRQILATENQINKCIELNSNTGSLTDCDLLFNK